MDEGISREARLENETRALKCLARLEDLTEKKTRIFSRLLMDTTLAKELEALAKRHANRKARLYTLMGEKQTGEKQ